MASSRAGSQLPVGSADWILKEFSDVSRLCENELEDFTFSARNEVEWLNEHMSDIFSSNRLQLAEILKTPGKLRGKTPRTARQRSPLKASRQPLGEISASKANNASLRTAAIELSSTNVPQDLQKPTPIKSLLAKPNTLHARDSGYQGNSQEEMEVELPQTQDLEGEEAHRASLASLKDLPLEKPQDPETAKDYKSEPKPMASVHPDGNIDSQTVTGTSVDPESEKRPTLGNNDAIVSDLPQVDTQTAEVKDEVAIFEDDTSELNQPQELQSGVDAKEPAKTKTLVRKSSLNFAPLPAREPLATKKSMGNVRVSSQTSYWGRITGGKSLGAFRPAHAVDDEAEEEEEKQNDDTRGNALRPTSRGETESSENTYDSQPLGVKSSTQRLADRITALGKAPAPRSTKSIAMQLQQQAQADLPGSPDAPKPESEIEKTGAAAPATEADEPWLDEHDGSSSPNYQVYPSSDAEENEEPPVSPPPAAAARTPIIQEAKLNPAEERISTTPAGSPPKAIVDQHAQHPVQASKSRLQTLMQSARGLFSSSAAASAEARLEASSAISTNMDTKTSAADDKTETSQIQVDEQIRREEDLSRGAGRATSEEAQAPKSAMAPPPRPRTALAKPTNNRRPIVKAVKDQPVQQKVSIKMGLMPGRRPLAAPSSASALREPDQSASRPLVTRKESTASLSTVSSTGSSRQAASSRAKAVHGTDKKEEAKAKAALKKAEQKREAERKKAAQQEEAQRREQARQAAERLKERERQAAEEKKRLEQRQAAEKKRADAHAKREQMQREQQQLNLKSSMHRPEPPRPVSRQASIQDFPKPPSSQPAGAKQANKRNWEAEHETGAAAQEHARGNTAYKQEHDGKRRKTNEDEEAQPQAIRPSMAPPVRMSAIKNGFKSSVFGSNYPRAPPPAAHHANVGQSSANLPTRGPVAPDNSRFQNGTIPFANGTANPQNQTAAPNPFKTPMQPARFGQTATAAQQQQQQQQQQQLKSSPFINGEHLHLDEIATDSEDEDSDTERDRKANLPDWVRTPNLNETLMQQETINPDAVFGPIAPLNMEEMFKGRGQKKDFRSRTSSANWFGSDRLTEDEIKKDMQAREKMRRDGGWTFGL